MKLFYQVFIIDQGIKANLSFLEEKEIKHSVSFRASTANEESPKRLLLTVVIQSNPSSFTTCWFLNRQAFYQTNVTGIPHFVRNDSLKFFQDFITFLHRPYYA
jgi:hypothetical protein